MKSSLKKDKKQITIDVVHSADGEVIWTEMIFAGLTDRCLPSNSKKGSKDYAMYEKIHLHWTDNHWASLGTKKKMAVDLQKHVVTAYAIINANLPAEGQEIPRALWFLDCWYVIPEAHWSCACPSNLCLFVLPGRSI